MRREIVAVTTGGNRFDAKANAKFGIAVHRTARPTTKSKSVRPNTSWGIVAGVTHTVATSTALPKTRVMKLTLMGSGAKPFFRATRAALGRIELGARSWTCW